MLKFAGGIATVTTVKPTAEVVLRSGVWGWAVRLPGLEQMTCPIPKKPVYLLGVVNCQAERAIVARLFTSMADYSWRH